MGKRKVRKSADKVKAWIEQMKVEHEPPEWMIKPMIDPRTGEAYFPPSLSSLWMPITNRQGLDFALSEIQDDDARNGIEKILRKALKARYVEERLYGDQIHKEPSTEHLGETIEAAKKTLKMMEAHREKGYNYYQRFMEQFVRAQIERLEYVRELMKKRGGDADVSVPVKETVTEIASFRDRGLKTNDQIGRLLIAVDLFDRIRCVYDDQQKLRPQITKKGLQIEKIPYYAQARDMKPRNTVCQHFLVESDGSLACSYPRAGYCQKARDKVQRLLTATKS